EDRDSRLPLTIPLAPGWRCPRASSADGRCVNGGDRPCRRSPARLRRSTCWGESSASSASRSRDTYANNTPLLWHIPLSHYNEKVRWALDYKGIAHRRQVLGPDYLIRAWRATGQGKLPILFLEGRAIADSTRIIAALEERYPEPPLYPRDAA